MPAPSAIREKHVGCAVCGRWFINDDSFERHRVPMPERVPPHRNDVRCMTDNEMTTAGMIRTRKGFWVRGTQTKGKQRT